MGSYYTEKEVKEIKRRFCLEKCYDAILLDAVEFSHYMVMHGETRDRMKWANTFNRLYKTYNRRYAGDEFFASLSGHYLEMFRSVKAVTEELKTAH